MSADEDEVDPAPGEAKKYVFRAPDYRSELVSNRTVNSSMTYRCFRIQVQTLYTTINSLPDPQPDKAKAMTTRLCGANLVDMVPPKAKKLENKIRKWQICADILARNPHWEANGRIATNGVAWGDEVDPVDVEAEKAKTKLKDKASVLKVTVNKSKKRKRAEAGTTGKGKARIDVILDGDDEDALFEV